MFLGLTVLFCFQDYASVNRSESTKHASESRPHGSAEINQLSQSNFPNGDPQRTSQVRQNQNSYRSNEQQTINTNCRTEPVFNGLRQNGGTADNSHWGGGGQKKRIEPLSSLRLRPTRHRTKHALANILRETADIVYCLSSYHALSANLIKQLTWGF